MLEDHVKHEILTATAHCVGPRCGAVDALLIARRHYGWISDETLMEIAELLHMTSEELDSVASFYNHLHRKPIGKHVILVCDSVCCWIMGSDRVTDYLTEKLGINVGGTTADGTFTLLPIQCLGACDKAPAMMIDDRLYVNLDSVTIDGILSAYEPTSAQGPNE